MKQTNGESLIILSFTFAPRSPVSNVEDLMIIQKKDDFTFLTLLLKLWCWSKTFYWSWDWKWWWWDEDDDDDYNDDERPSIGPGTPYPHPLHTRPTRGSRSAHFFLAKNLYLRCYKEQPSPDGGFIYATLWKLWHPIVSQEWVISVFVRNCIS